MEAKKTGVGFLKEYRAHPENYLPLIDHQYKHFEEWEDEIMRNISWSAGVGHNNRPWFAERYDIFLNYLITVFIPPKGMEDWDEEFTAQFLLLFWQWGLITGYNPHNNHTVVTRYTDHSGNEFFSVNMVLGALDEHEDYHSWIGWNEKLYPFSELDQLNEGAVNDIN